MNNLAQVRTVGTPKKMLRSEMLSDMNSVERRERFNKLKGEYKTREGEKFVVKELNTTNTSLYSYPLGCYKSNTTVLEWFAFWRIEEAIELGQIVKK